MVLRMMYLVITLSATLFCLPKALAQNAVGITIGGPTYIHFTHSLHGPAAVEAGLSFSYNHATHIYGDYFIETHTPFRNPQLSEMGLFYGVGAMIVIVNDDHYYNGKNGYYGDRDGDVGLGVRFPVGIDWRPAQTKEFTFHAQVVPIIAVVPETELEFNAGLGLKFHF